MGCTTGANTDARYRTGPDVMCQRLHSWGYSVVVGQGRACGPVCRGRHGMYGERYTGWRGGLGQAGHRSMPVTLPGGTPWPTQCISPGRRVTHPAVQSTTHDTGCMTHRVSDWCLTASCLVRLLPQHCGLHPGDYTEALVATRCYRLASRPTVLLSTGPLYWTYPCPVWGTQVFPAAGGKLWTIRHVGSSTPASTGDDPCARLG